MEERYISAIAMVSSIDKVKVHDFCTVVPYAHACPTKKIQASDPSLLSHAY